MPKKTRKMSKIFHKSDYHSGDGMLTAVWGPGMWHYLHTMSFNYPTNPTIEDKQNYRNFILNLQNVLPCKFCRENFKLNVTVCPLTLSHLANRETFSKYVYTLHELVNKRLGKKSGLSYCAVRERYEHFRARCVDDKHANVLTKKEKGCTEPLYGKKSKCLLKIVPIDDKGKTLEIDKQCFRPKK